MRASATSALLAVLLACSGAQAANHSRLVYPGPDGKLVYKPDARGNTIPDFSHCGYAGGGVAIPDVPTRVTLEPDGDDKDDGARIQAAIDRVAKMPLDGDGFRGAVLLRKGTYRVAGTLHIQASGVVLRGDGQGRGGTVIIAAGAKKRTLIQAKGSGRMAVVQGTRHAIVDAYVPVGARSFRVDSTAGLAVGDSIIVHRPSTKEWIHAIGMDRIERKKNRKVVQWKPGSYDFRFDRTITKIDSDRITIDAALGNAIQKEFGGGWIYKYKWPGRIAQVGIEHMRSISEFDRRQADKRRQGEFVDEDHAWNFAAMSFVQNAWVRNVTCLHFGYSLVMLGRGGKWITVQDCVCLDPVSRISGGRRYSFGHAGAQLSLIQRCVSRGGRHDFVNHARVPGPNVFLDCFADRAYSDSGPHHRWSMATLYDNVVVPRNALNVQDRQASGTGHGWAGSQMVFWNCRARSIICQRPPTSQNYCIGCMGKRSPGRYKREQGHWEFPGRPVAPRSLYLTQLEDRLGAAAVRAVATQPQFDGTILEVLRRRATPER